ncbi:MAG: hypothetical protein HYY11_01840 [Candidatus Methylomirabilis oxyfera]|nr:hypothetical protein [Candidatus Methylomirabilis oxyfera]
MRDNLSERLRQRQADLSDELTRQSGPVSIVQARLRGLARPWPVDYDPKDFREAVFPWLADLHRSFTEARSVRDGWTSTIAALEREREALHAKLTAGELESLDYDRDRARYHIRKIEAETYREALVRIDDGLRTAERDWERVRPIVEAEIERYADVLFKQEQRTLQKEVEEMLTRYTTVRVHAAELSLWHSTLQERFGLTIRPRRVRFDPELPATHNFAVSIEMEGERHG